MSRYLTLINEIKDYITDNGKGEITGGRLQRVLEDMVNKLGDHTKFIGVVAPEDKFEGAEGYLFAFAVKAGVYTNFGGYEVRPDEIAILIYDGGWKKYGIDVVTDAQLENTVVEINRRLNDLSNAVNVSLQKLSNEIGGTINDLDNKLSGNIEDLAKTVDNLVVQELGDSKDKVVSQKVVKDELKKMNDVIKDQVVQEFGDSTNTIISQKVVTERFGEVEEEIETLAKTKVAKQQSAEQGNVVMFGEGGEVADSNIEASNVAKQNGYYESMIVGASKNLAGNNVVTAKYTYRPTADTTDVADGVAKISSVKGNTIVWNQLFDLHYQVPGGIGITWTIENNKLVGNGTATTTCFSNIATINIFATHKYYFRTKGNFDELITAQVFTAGFEGFYNQTIPYNQIVSPLYDGEYAFRVRVAAGATLSNAKFSLSTFDLTQMFGEGNEPTIEEFEAMFPNDYYEYNEGELRSIEDFSIKSVGFNQISGLRQGYINSSEIGTDINSIILGSNNVLSYPIKVFPNTYYYLFIKNAGWYIVEYDCNKKLCNTNYAIGISTLYKTKENTHYILLQRNRTTIQEEINKINFNLSHTNYRNGEYEPYQEDILPINISTIKDENGEQLFPNGLCSAGEAHDELVYDKGIGKWKAVKRIGSVDMGSLNWVYNDENVSTAFPLGFFSVVYKVKSVRNLISAKYLIRYTQDQDKCIVANSEGGAIYIVDSTFNNNDLLKQSLQGQILYYELAEPIEVVLDDFTSNYKVSDWGTEEILMNSIPVIPVIYDVEYALNAVDTLRNMPTNYISKESLDAFLSALGSAMGGTWTATYNETNGRYDFSFSANASATELTEE